jgi:hypothetical protein
MLAPMLSAFHFLTHIARGFILANLWPATRRDWWMIVQNCLVMGLTLLGALAIAWRR